jgi:hypothetical protein
MKKIKLEDSFRVSDSKVKGYVVIKEGDKIILKKENMIVASGRKFIKDKTFGSSSKSISKILFGKGTTPTQATDTVSTIDSVGYYDTGDTSNFSINLTDNLTTVITINLDKNSLGVVSDTSLSELGLVLTESEEDDILFSRLTFDAIPLTIDHSYEIKYYIYF